LFVENRVLSTRLQTQRLRHRSAFAFSAYGRKLELTALKSGELDKIINAFENDSNIFNLLLQFNRLQGYLFFLCDVLQPWVVA
jgi:hypothetical protein